MNWEHLRAFLWLRSRLRANQNKRAGMANVWLQRLFYAIGILVGAAALAGSFFVGLFPLRNTPPGLLMLIWDGVIVAFVLVWLTELFSELQRAELLAIEKFLHLPVSLNSAFLINYTASIASPGVGVMTAIMAGLSTGLLFSRGLAMLPLFPLILAFVLTVTSIGYQFRGWLASLMMDKRRRRTVMTIAGIAFVLIFQLPYFATMPWRTRNARERRTARDVNIENVQRVAASVNLAVPLGWLPYGAMRAAEGRFGPALLGALGLTLIAAASLRRSYMTTLRLYTGDFGNRPARPRKAPPPADRIALGEQKEAFLEKRLPWISEEASAVFAASCRSLYRAPETRILLLSPIVGGLFFGTMFLRGAANPPELLRPLMAAGGIGMVYLFLMQLAGNQFGFDRHGFRSYVLSPARRRDILIGKNLALAPIALGMTLIVVLLFQWAYPMRIDHFIATALQTVPMFFVFCLLENMLSIYAPMPVAAGSFKPAQPKGIQFLIHLLFFAMFPPALSVTLIPLGIEFLLGWAGWSTWFPAYLVFILLECAAVFALYPALIDWEGRILQSREREILELVTSKTE